MRGYAGIERSLSACLHFVRNDEVDEPSLLKIVQVLKDRGIVCAYVDYGILDQSRQSVINCVGNLLNLENRPYADQSWVRFLDDLISLSAKVNGAVIVIDRADVFFEKDRNEAFDLIESFLIQFHHWLERKKPCHLCFQMEANALIRQMFQPLSEARI